MSSWSVLSFFVFAYGVGLIAAIPIGPAQIEAAKRALSGNRRAGLSVAVGSVSSDLLYGSIALFGLASFLETPWIQAVFNGVGIGVLWVLSYFTFREAEKDHSIQAAHFRQKSLWASYWIGFTLSASNLPMILNWLFAVTLAEKIGLHRPDGWLEKTAFVLGGVLGILSYLCGVVQMVFRSKSFVTSKTIRMIYRGLGVALLVFSFFLIARF